MTARHLPRVKLERLELGHWILRHVEAALEALCCLAYAMSGGQAGSRFAAREWSKAGGVRWVMFLPRPSFRPDDASSLHHFPIRARHCARFHWTSSSFQSRGPGRREVASDDWQGYEATSRRGHRGVTEGMRLHALRRRRAPVHVFDGAWKESPWTGCRRLHSRADAAKITLESTRQGRVKRTSHSQDRAR